MSLYLHKQSVELSIRSFRAYCLIFRHTRPFCKSLCVPLSICSLLSLLSLSLSVCVCVGSVRLCALCSLSPPALLSLCMWLCPLCSLSLSLCACACACVLGLWVCASVCSLLSPSLPSLLSLSLSLSLCVCVYIYIYI